MHTHQGLVVLCISILIADGYGNEIEKELNKRVPHYRFRYLVKDAGTGDYKTQEEERNGDTVKGRYSVAEPNGDLRVVTYTADQHSGFQAKVEVHPGGSPLMEKKHPTGIESVVTTITTPTTSETPKSDPPETTPIPSEVETSSQGTTTEDPPEVTDTPISKSESVKRGECDKDEGRAHITSSQDKVQLEMEKVIRAEMVDPTTIEMGQRKPQYQLVYPYLPSVKSHTKKEAPLPITYGNPYFTLQALGEGHFQPKALFYNPYAFVNRPMSVTVRPPPPELSQHIPLYTQRYALFTLPRYLFVNDNKAS